MGSTFICRAVPSLWHLFNCFLKSVTGTRLPLERLHARCRESNSLERSKGGKAAAGKSLTARGHYQRPEWHNCNVMSGGGGSRSNGSFSSWRQKASKGQAAGTAQSQMRTQRSALLPYVWLSCFAAASACPLRVPSVWNPNNVLRFTRDCNLFSLSSSAHNTIVQIKPGESNDLHN